jgi:hypothetical protein
MLVLNSASYGNSRNKDCFDVEWYRSENMPADLFTKHLLWHHRLGDASMRHIQTLLANPRDSLATQILVPKKASASTCAITRCEAFLYVKQKRNPTATTVKHRVPEQEGALSDGILEPGQKVSVDLFQSTIPGLLLTPKDGGNT